ncbi:MAG: hypothetical protein CMB47_06740 [Euryarchaeota archaeon]|nr:hypothetical protein [Euryarchaeota archaeon]|tara:strand:+ start:404 stop:598 length:195 start_codon:yes stop_codon:yes gene_type:complete
MKEDLENKMLAAAISAVLLFEPEGSIIKISSGRDKGSLWFQEHTRIIIGKTSLSNERSKRSILR